MYRVGKGLHESKTVCNSQGVLLNNLSNHTIIVYDIVAQISPQTQLAKVFGSFHPYRQDHRMFLSHEA